MKESRMKQYPGLITVVLLAASVAFGGQWTRNSFPGPGHKADPSYPPGQGTDRVQWMPGFHVSPLDGDFKFVFDNMGSGHYSRPDSNGQEFWPIPSKSFTGTAAMGFSTHVAERAWLIWTEPYGEDHVPDDQINGIWKTTDGGDTYTHIRSVPNGHYMPATRPWGHCRILEDPHVTRSDHIYYGSYTEGLVRSTDGGSTWSVIEFTDKFIKTLSAVVDGSNTILYVIVGDTMPAHVDGTIPAPIDRDTRRLPVEAEEGELWQFVISASGSYTRARITAYTDFIDVQVNPGDLTEVWILRGLSGISGDSKGSASYLYRYVMSGSTVDSENLELQKSDIGNHSFGYVFINPANEDHIVLQNDAKLEYALVYSTDGGVTWSGKPRGATGSRVHLPTFNPIDYHFYNSNNPEQSWMQNKFHSVKGPRVGFEPGDVDDVYWYTSNHNTTLLHSTDGGATFMPYGYGTGTKEVRQMSVCNNDNDMAAGLGEYGFITSHDGGLSWRGATYENDTTLATLSESAELDYGVKAAKTHVGMGVALNPSDPNELVGIYSGACFIVRSTDGGLSWTDTGTKLGNWSSSGCYWSSSDPNYVYASNFRSSDGGINWTPLTYYVKAMSAGNNSHLLGSDKNISLTASFILYFSKDKGDSWIQLPAIPKETKQLRGGGSQQLNIRAGTNYAVAIDPRSDCDPNVPGNQIRVLVAGRSGIYDYVATSETDGVSGGTWAVRDTGLVNSAHYNKVDPVPWMGSVFFDPREGCENVVYASKSSNVKNVLGDWGELDNLNHDYPEGNTKAAIYKSADGGINWTNIHDTNDLPEWFQVRHVTVSSTGRLCANVWDAGLYFYQELIAAALTDDTFVYQGNPTSNKGGMALMRVRDEARGWGNEAFLKFNVSDTGPGTVQSATLNVRSQTSINNVSVYPVSDNTWDEMTLNWDNKPARGSLLDTANSIDANTWIALDVTGAVTGDGTYSFTLDSTQDKSQEFSTKEEGLGFEATLNIVRGPGGGNDPSDINGDGGIDYVDFAVISAYFMDGCAAPLWCGGADLNLSGSVDPNDVKIVVERWLTEVSP